MNNPPERPSGFAAAHAQRHAKVSRELAEAHGGGTLNPIEGPPAAEPAPADHPKPDLGSPCVRAVTDRTRSGTQRTTFIGKEPRSDVEHVTGPLGHNPPARRARFGRVHHLLGDLDGQR